MLEGIVGELYSSPARAGSIGTPAAGRFGTREAAAASAGRAAERVREHLADLYDGGPPEVAPGEVMPAIAA